MRLAKCNTPKQTITDCYKQRIFYEKSIYTVTQVVNIIKSTLLSVEIASVKLNINACK